MQVNALLVDGDPITQAFLRRVVRESFSDQIAFTGAGSARAARHTLSLLSKQPASADLFQLILVDWELPGWESADLLADLAKYPATKIVTTKGPIDGHLLGAVVCGADGFLSKSDRFEVLIEELQKAARGQVKVSRSLAEELLRYFGSSMCPPTLTLASPELEVLSFLSKGFTIKEIAHLLGMKWLQVNDSLRAIFNKISHR